MSQLAVAFLVVLVGVALAAVTGFVAFRSAGWRRLIASGVAVVLALLSVGGLFWTTLPSTTPATAARAPVDAALTLYTVGQSCHNALPLNIGCGSDLSIIAADAQTGDQRWIQRIGAEYNVQTVMAADQTALYSFVGSASGSVGGTLTAWRAADGYELWQRSVASFPQQIEVSGDQLLLFSSNDSNQSSLITVLSVRDGHELVRRSLQPLLARFVVSDGLIYGYTGNIVALRVSDLSEAWRLAPEWVGTAPKPMCDMQVADGVLYVERGSANGLRAVRVRDGQLLWRDDGAEGRLVTAGNGLVYLSVFGPPQSGVFQEQIRALRATDGTFVWQRALPDGSATIKGVNDVTQSLAAGDVLYLDGSTLLALHAPDGAPLWQHAEKGHRFIVSAVSNGVLFVLAVPDYSSNSVQMLTYMLALSTVDGHEYWRHNVASVTNRLQAGA